MDTAEAMKVINDSLDELIAKKERDLMDLKAHKLDLQDTFHVILNLIKK